MIPAPPPISNVLAGLIVTVLLGFVLPFVMKIAKKSMPLTPPNGADPRQQAQWQELTRGNEGGAVLGWLERLMFFAAFAAGASIAVGAWLAFKVASSRAQGDRGRSRSSRSLRSSHCAPSMGLPRAHDVSDRHRLQHSSGFDRRWRRCVLARDRPSTLPLTAPPSLDTVIRGTAVATTSVSVCRRTAINRHDRRLLGHGLRHLEYHHAS
jgi:hypothetical protein